MSILLLILSSIDLAFPFAIIGDKVQLRKELIEKNRTANNMARFCTLAFSKVKIVFFIDHAYLYYRYEIQEVICLVIKNPI